MGNQRQDTHSEIPKEENRKKKEENRKKEEKDSLENTIDATPISDQLIWISDDTIATLSSRPLERCLVIASGDFTNLFILKATDCVFIFTKRVDSYGMIQHTKNCLVYLHGIGQLRCHDCFDLKVYGWVNNGPIIEDCKNVSFGELQIDVPLTTTQSTQSSDCVNTNLNVSSDCVNTNLNVSSDCVNNILNVQDFNWLSQSKSPNVKCVRDAAILEALKAKLKKLFQAFQPAAYVSQYFTVPLMDPLSTHCASILSFDDSSNT